MRAIKDIRVLTFGKLSKLTAKEVEKLCRGRPEIHLLEYGEIISAHRYSRLVDITKNNGFIYITTTPSKGCGEKNEQTKTEGILERTIAMDKAMALQIL